MNTQEAFNTMVTHLLTQNEICLDPLEGDCMYHAPDGKKCAVGILIPEDMYKPEMEMQTISQITAKFSEIKELFEDVDKRLLTKVQNCHDNFEVVAWKIELIRIAKKYDLTMPEVKNDTSV